MAVRLVSAPHVIAKFAPSVGVAERSRQVVVTVLEYLFVGDIPDVGGPLPESRP